MRLLLIYLVFFISSNMLSGQTQMEAECQKKIIKFSRNKVFPKHEGPIVIKGDTIEYARSFIILSNSNRYAFLVFQKGLLFPESILGASTTGSGEHKMSTVGFIGTLSISSFEQIKNPDIPPTIKMFSFLLWQRNLLNPKLYILQLTNEKANTNTSDTDFIQKARLSAFGFCSILI